MKLVVIGILGSLFLFSSSLQANESLTSHQIENLEIQAATNDELAFQLGYGFIQGTQGLHKDIERGKSHLKKLAARYPVNHNAAKAAFVLGKLYLGAEEHIVVKESAIKYFRIASQYAEVDGLAEAPYQVAMASEDDEEYLEQMKKAGNAGFVPAMLQLFVSYMNGQRLYKNEKAAVAWLKEAAHKGHAEAQAELGTYFFNGEIAYKDYERAYYWTVRAAEQNHSGAQAQLGLMYKLGLGRPVNKKKARLWFERAHLQSNMLATENLGGLLLESSDKAEQKQGVDMMATAAEAGAKSAAIQMVRIYEQGIGVDKDIDQAMKWKNRASSIDDVEGANLIGVNKVTRDDKKAYKVSLQTVEQYELGIEAAKSENWQIAKEHLTKAAMDNYPAAQLDLARVYISIAQKKQDAALYEKAFTWAKIALDGKQPEAKVLVDKLTEVLPTKMLEDSLRQYNLLKVKIVK